MTFTYTTKPAANVGLRSLVRYEGEHWKVEGRAQSGRIVKLKSGDRTTVVRGNTRVEVVG